MPFKIIKSSYDYCAENKLFFIFVLVLLFVCQYIANLIKYPFVASVIITVIMLGYGLQVTRDIINGGKRLPKIMPKDVFVFGVKGYFIMAFYAGIQLLLLAYFSGYFNFPLFELEEMILNYSDTIQLFINHDIVSFTLFVSFGIIVVYVTSFFMELSLARLADGGSVFNAFKFRRIKHAIDIIGWRSYAWDYTKIILSIVILTYFLHYEIPVHIVDAVSDSILSFLIFVIEFIGIGEVYRVYIESKTD